VAEDSQNPSPAISDAADAADESAPSNSILMFKPRLSWPS